MNYKVSEVEYVQAKKDFKEIEKKFRDLKCSWGGDNYSPEQLEVMNEWDSLLATIASYEQELQISPNER